MELKNESNELVPFVRQFIIPQMRYRGGVQHYRAGIRRIQQTKDIKQGAFSAPGWAHHGVHRAWLELERNPAQCMHARFVFAEEAFNIVATKADFRRNHGFLYRYTLEPRNVDTGASPPARRAGT